jgi:hypothetical protein
LIAKSATASGRDIPARTEEASESTASGQLVRKALDLIFTRRLRLKIGMKVAPTAAIKATIGIEVMMSAMEPVTNAAIPIVV